MAALRGCNAPAPSPKSGATRERGEMRQAIHTKFHGPTGKQWIRYSATCAAGRVMMPQLDNVGPAGNHRAAAAELCRKLGWSTDGMVSGFLKDGSGVHVFGGER